jgi:alkanesulfonate monooxygenase SsuD/methylene tetrahydromethanopterin reductase-like flavin-dependent oxidoreductase (luciferase family)
LIRRLWTEDWVDFEGEYYRVQNARLYDRPDTPPPLYIAASGPRSAELAGREGDGWVTDVGTVRAVDTPARRAFVDAAKAAAKDPDALPLVTEFWAVVGTRDDALEAARKWRFLPAFNDVVNVADPREVQRIAEERVPLERVIESWVVSEDPAEHIAAVHELAEKGATHIFLHPPQDDQRRVIDFYGQHVLPALR